MKDGIVWKISVRPHQQHRRCGRRSSPRAPPIDGADQHRHRGGEIPIISDVRAPCAQPAAMSRPSWSVPNR